MIRLRTYCAACAAEIPRGAKCYGYRVPEHGKESWMGAPIAQIYVVCSLCVKGTSGFVFGGNGWYLTSPEDR